MPTYMVTYKFGQTPTTLERQDRFMAQVQIGDWWAETGSAIVIHSDEPIDLLCARLFAPRCFDPRFDIAVVFDLDRRNGRARGQFRDFALFTVAPWIERL